MPSEVLHVRKEATLVVKLTDGKGCRLVSMCYEIMRANILQTINILGNQVWDPQLLESTLLSLVIYWYFMEVHAVL